MNGVVEIMMKCIRKEVCGWDGQIVLPDFSSAFFQSLYKLSKSHDVAHLVGEALAENNLPSTEGLDAEEAGAIDLIKAKFQKQTMMAVYRYENINAELENIRSIFNADKIPFIPLKGSVLRDFYPLPYQRTSCDIDVLVHEDDLDRAVAALEKDEAFTVDSKGSHDVGLFSGGGVHLELHYSLIESKVIGTAEKLLEDVWDYALKIGETSEYRLIDEFFYYYHVAHAAKHFVNGGCGVRPLIDTWILEHEVVHDEEKRVALLERGGLSEFAKQIELLAEVWFGDAEPTETTEKIEKYVLSGGVYGTTENRVSVQQVKKGGKVKYALSRIWLPYDTLKFHYPSLEKHRWLLPFYEVRRWCKLIFCGGVKRSVNELSYNAQTKKEDREEVKDLLAKLNLDE